MSTEEKYLAYLKRVGADLRQTKRRLREVEDRAQEPIAIVGIGCRLPGGADSPEALWRLLSEGTDVISELPVNRNWDVEGSFDLDPDRHGKNYVREGGFLHDAGEFDPAFFGISPREALAMDPQQRLLLETSWETIERAGIDPHSLKGTKVGTFVGCNYSDYCPTVEDAPEELEGHILTGTVPSVLSGRIAYTLGLEGPAVTIDTACSSSLIALHLACHSLRQGESSLALAGGVAVMANMGSFIGFSRQRALAADGRCKAFDASADGMSLAEGVTLVLLERLSDARKNGHEVLAVVRASAVNQDGASNGLSAPNGMAQQRVIRQALTTARLSAGQVDVVEAHGTGTSLGDPIEAQALLATYGQGRPADRPLLLGSIKSNIGHAQAASGMAGLIKMVLAIQHGVVPKTLHVTEPTPHVDWSAGAVSLLTETVPWPQTGEPRRAGVSSFGISGTNVHVIIEEEPPVEVSSDEESEEVVAEEVPEHPAIDHPIAPLVLSGKSENALLDQASRLLDHLREHPSIALKDLGLSLATTRSAFEHRAVVLAASGLESLVRGEADPSVITGTTRAAGRTVFVFPGQGSQWLGMALELADSAPVFGTRLDECAAALAPHTDWDLRDALSDEQALNRVDVVQPVLWAVMVSLAALWRSFGVEPAAVIGHSQGEIAAAAVSGALSLEDAAAVVALRSKAILQLAGRGGMVSVSLPLESLNERIARWDGRISVAAVNGPASVVVSGDPDALAELVAECEAEEIRARTIPVDYASHSAHVESIEDELLTVLAGITPREPEVPFFSTVTGEWLDSPVDAGYWYRNLRQTVHLEQATRALIEQGYRSFIEASAHPVLTMAVQATAEAAGGEVVAVGSLRRDEGGLDRFVTSLAEAHSRGVAVDWRPLFAGANRVGLPTYAFQRQNFWLELVSREAAVSEMDADFWAAVEREDLDSLATTLDLADRSSLDTVVPALSSWLRKRRTQSTVDGWRYRSTWQPVTEKRSPALSGTWLLVVPPTSHEWFAVEDVLRERGAEVVRVTVPSGTDRASLAAQLDSGAAGVLSLLALDEDMLPVGLTRGLAATVMLTQALGDAGIDAPLWTLTSGAVSVGRNDPLTSPNQAAVRGLALAAAAEIPQRWGGLVDVPVGFESRAASRLCAVLAGTDEDQLAVRSQGAYARRLTPAPLGAATAPEWKPSGTVLITGGTGTLAAHLGRWLAGRGAEHLLLTSRRGPDAPGAASLQSELKALGAEVTIAACDVSDRAALAALLADIPADRPLSAVIHAAGVVDDVVLDQLTPERIAGVLRPKLDAARHLHELTENSKLDAFVLFSSFGGTLPDVGQGAYAAANAYLDALAESRAASGLPATSLGWGSWGSGGLVSAELEERMRQQGMLPMDPALAITGLAQAVDHGEPVLTVAAIEWDRFPQTTAHCPLINDIPAVVRARASATPEEADSGSAFVQKLTAASPTERERIMVDLVRANAATVLGHSDSDAVDEGRAFKEIGFDSLTSVELRNRVAAATGLQLPATLAFDFPNPVEMARHLLTKLLGDTATAAAVTVAAVTDEPIAIVGMACRFPGGIAAPEQLWELVSQGRDAITEFPTDRGWDVANLYHPDPDHAGTSYTRHGGFLHDAAGFDADFFGMSPREALATDPQQRLLLETSWEAVERAGIDPRGLKGSATGVFVGSNGFDYAAAPEQVPDDLQGYVLTGSNSAVISGRISYTLGLEGPAITVDTACSASLVAMHLAAQALRGGECSLALAGGATVLSTPGTFISFSRQRGLAPDGRCKPFADAADGTGWGEGAGMLVLERLSDARENGHPVLAVIRGSAINQDGASNGLTAPNGPSQQRVIRAALANAGLSTSDVDVVEAHGTGTTLGDPIEAQALLATYGQDRDEPLWLGSVKSNIGHTQAAAGVAGVMKMVLAMGNGTIPQTLHVDQPSTQVEWSTGAISLATSSQPWPETGRPRTAAVSSFGVSGTNAHLIIQHAPAFEEAVASPADQVVPLVLSAHSEQALRDKASQLRAVLGSSRPVDLAHALLTARAVQRHRAVVVGEAGLVALSEGKSAPGLVSGLAGKPGRIAFAFPGQGSQRAGMGQELYAAFPAFADALDEVCVRLDAHLPRPLREVIFAGGEELDQTEFTQPALFAIGVALYRLLAAHGVTPDYLIGHSIGEIAAAHVSGVLSLEDAALLVTTRARLMQALPVGGAMLAIAATEDEVLPLLTDRVSVAAVNGPTSVVIAGDEDAVLEIGSRFARTRRLRVSHAFHSPLMEPMLAAFRSVTSKLTHNAPQIPVVSTVDGGFAEFNAEYWVRHARQAVRYADAVDTLVAERIGTFVELGPNGVLTAMTQDCLPEDSAATLVATLPKNIAETTAVLTALGRLHIADVPVDWTPSVPVTGHVDLPTYPFQHQRYWLTPTAAAGDLGSAGLSAGEHPFVGALTTLADSGQLLLTGRLSLSAHPWLADHAARGTVLLPGTAFVELALHAGDQVGCALLEELTLYAPLTFAEDSAVSFQLRVDAPDQLGRRELTVHSRTDEDWVLHASGWLAPVAPAVDADLVTWPPTYAVPVALDGFYSRLAETGFDYGPAFQGLRAAWRRGDEVFAEVELPGEAGDFGLHPALLDAAVQTVGLREADENSTQGLMPFSWNGVSLHATGATQLRVRLTSDKGDTVSLVAADRTGGLVATVESLTLRPLAVDLGNPLYRVDWVPVPTAPQSVPTDWADVRGADGLLALARGPESPATVLISFVASSEDVVASTHQVTTEALSALQTWLSTAKFADSTLVVLTKGGQDGTDLGHAAIWGLVRAAQAENPGRFVLLDNSGASPQELVAAVATGEPQLAIRDGVTAAPRMVRAAVTTESRGLDSSGTVLLTGATGTLGALMAKHLITTHGVRHLLLTSRRGMAAPGAEELAALGAQVVACDVADKAALSALLADIPEDRPLTAVVHVAGVIDDGVIESLTPEQVTKVLRPKVDAALALHECTAHLDLSAFVLFSSASGTLGGPGQGNYAAGNAFLDAYATHLRGMGVPATSLVWGLWADASGMTGALSQGDLARISRGGLAPMSASEALGLFDVAVRGEAPVLAPVKLHMPALRTLAENGDLPALFKDLVRAPVRRAARGADTSVSYQQRLAGMSESARAKAVLELVCEYTATVLGHSGGQSVEPDRAFTELGFDSLTAVELRNQLTTATGLRLPATLVFDFPSPQALAEHVRESLFPAVVADTDEELRRMVASVSLESLREAGLLESVLSLAGKQSAAKTPAGSATSIDDMDIDSLVDLALEN
ncbi:type I polyketide synthase [Allokutzneria sp. NRRL B-24872]|uniref:type I polyketide synthase n=1 Tax=Allokutzneria sp. NRRL B-24872 TaxID=1137961 RepID=UPI000A36FE55|nr:type I polyketide synthase [Allokutzneria sp. NRRL B-24872]